jgi:glutamate dehydrogenase (NADP+)
MITDIFEPIGAIVFNTAMPSGHIKAVSGLEMTQNSMRLSWSEDDVEKRLHGIMTDIHDKCVQYGTEDGYINYRKGANIAGFVKVADAMVACGNI